MLWFPLADCSSKFEDPKHKFVYTIILQKKKKKVEGRREMMNMDTLLE